MKFNPPDPSLELAATQTTYGGAANSNKLIKIMKHIVPGMCTPSRFGKIPTQIENNILTWSDLPFNLSRSR